MSDTETKKDQQTPKKNWREIAEVRMLMYVIPVGIAMALIGFVLSQLTAR